MSMLNYYEVMGVAEDASPAELKRIYLLLAKAYHPDAGADKKGEERLKQINEAYDVLKDPEKRKKYDEKLRMERRNTNTSPSSTTSGQTSSPASSTSQSSGQVHRGYKAKSTTSSSYNPGASASSTGQTTGSTNPSGSSNVGGQTSSTGPSTAQPSGVSGNRTSNPGQSSATQTTNTISQPTSYYYPTPTRNTNYRKWLFGLVGVLAAVCFCYFGIIKPGLPPSSSATTASSITTSSTATSSAKASSTLPHVVNEPAKGKIIGVENAQAYYYSLTGSGEMVVYKATIDGLTILKLASVEAGLENAAISNGWIYFCRNGNLARMSVESGKTQNISNFQKMDIKDFVVSTDWIYFILEKYGENAGDYLCKVHTDGSGYTELSKEDRPELLQVSDNRLSYSLGCTIYSMNVDGTDRRRVWDFTKNNQCCEHYVMTGKYFYYTLDVRGGIILYNVNLDGKMKAVSTQITNAEICNLTKIYSVNNGWAYYFLDVKNAGESSGYCLWRAPLQGGKQQQITGPSISVDYPVAVDGDWVYYTNKTQQICKIRVDGTGNVPLRQ